MRGHVHFDVVHVLFTALAVALTFHVMRGTGAIVGSRVSPGAGKLIAGIATFN